MKSRTALLLSALAVLVAQLACGLFSRPAAKAPQTSPTPTATAQPATVTPALEPPRMETLPPARPAADPYYATGDRIVLDEIHMLSLTDGWALSGPFVLATGDGGVTWRQVNPPAALPEGTWLAGSGSQALETSDGGQTWGPADKPDSFLPGDRVGIYGAFLDARTAWVVYSTGSYFRPDTHVWHTADGGRTWAPSEGFAPQVRGDVTWARMFALDAENLWLMACAGWVGAGQHFDCEFFRSRDGGVRWNTMDVDGGVDFTGMGFSDASHGWLIWQTLSAYYYIPPEYAFTVDGGLTWEHHTFPPPPGASDLFTKQFVYCEPYQLNLLSSRSVRLLVGCFDYGYPPEAFESYLYASDDGGMTWSALRLPAPVHAPEYALMYFGADEALLLGREMYSSADGGGTWTHFKTVYWDGGFSFIDRQHGWAVARADDEVALVSTSDGGATWTEIHPIIGE